MSTIEEIIGRESEVVGLPQPIGGVIPPLITPLSEDKNLATREFVALVNWVITGGAHGLFLLGSTGEFSGLSRAVKESVIDEGCKATAGRIPVVVNVSDTCLAESVNLANNAAKAGAAAVALCPPYYFSITQRDLARHVQRFCEQVDLPVFLYNIPQCAHIPFEIETVYELSQLPRVVGIKNSSGDLKYLAAVVQIKNQRPEFSVLVGTEELTVAAIELGANGSVCGGANMFPDLYVALFNAISEKRLMDARRLQALVEKIAARLYTIGPKETSYLRGLKGAMAELGICRGIMADPLSSLDSGEREELRSRLSELLPEVELSDRGQVTA